MSIAVSMTVGTVYGMYMLGTLGSPHEKKCLANQIDYHPYQYENQEEMMAFLSTKGAENVTQNID